jgi:hypothetical protein
MKCQKCKKNYFDGEIEEHHIHPRFMDNKKGNGMKAYLCPKCHHILHLKIPAIYWTLLSNSQKQKAIELVKSWTKKEVRYDTKKTKG